MLYKQLKKFPRRKQIFIAASRMSKAHSLVLSVYTYCFKIFTPASQS